MDTAQPKPLSLAQLRRLRACGSGFKSIDDYKRWEATASEFWERIIDTAVAAIEANGADKEPCYECGHEGTHRVCARCHAPVVVREER